jgi:hypothetical protein
METKITFKKAAKFIDSSSTGKLTALREFAYLYRRAKSASDHSRYALLDSGGFDRRRTGVVMVAKLIAGFGLLSMCLCINSLAMKVPEAIKECVVFVFVKSPTGVLVPNGTAFIVMVPDQADKNRARSYLATARHVLSEKPFGQLHKEVYIRVNLKSGGVGTIPLALSSSSTNKNVYFHPDDFVDVALVPFGLNHELVNFRAVTPDLLTTKERFKALKIGEGSDVFFTGMFTPHVGDSKNYPIVRFGRVALIPEEKVEFAGSKMELYLIESMSFGGNSGSPVFFYLGSDRDPDAITGGPPALFLAGIMMGSYQNRQALEIVQTAAIPMSASNLGIAAVVPAYRLDELLNLPELNDFSRNPTAAPAAPSPPASNHASSPPRPKSCKRRSR